jgi:hypothetical protein
MAGTTKIAATPRKAGCACGSCASCSARHAERDTVDRTRAAQRTVSPTRDARAIEHRDRGSADSRFGFGGSPSVSLTTGEDDGRIVRTLDDGGALPGGVPMQGPGPLQPTGSHPCVPTVVTSSLPSGHIAARKIGGAFAAPFTMSADFDTPIPCNGVCGEYRQFVSGFFQMNGVDLVHPLCGNSLSRTTEYEDCLTSGGTNYKYGYHSLGFATSRFSNPDQATGWSYRGEDAPGFVLATIPSGSVLNMSLSFRGELVDACDRDRRLQPSTTWTTGGTYTVP